MMLSMTFVAFLLLAIALTTIAIANAYQRGIMLSNVNIAGRVVATDLQRTISQAPATQTIQFGTTITSTGGALCLGTYSYIWNNGKDLQAGSPGLIKYGAGPNSGKPVRLAKVLDTTKSECPSTGPVPSPGIFGSIPVELLPNDGANSYNGLALQTTGTGGTAQQALMISSTPVLSDATQAMYQVVFTLGTNDQNALNTTQANAPSCQPPSSSNSNLNYCAVNQFVFYVRTGGGAS